VCNKAPVVAACFLFDEGLIYSEDTERCAMLTWDMDALNHRHS